MVTSKLLDSVQSSKIFLMSLLLLCSFGCTQVYHLNMDVIKDGQSNDRMSYLDTREVKLWITRDYTDTLYSDTVNLSIGEEHKDSYFVDEIITYTDRSEICTSDCSRCHNKPWVTYSVGDLPPGTKITFINATRQRSVYLPGGEPTYFRYLASGWSRGEAKIKAETERDNWSRVFYLLIIPIPYKWERLKTERSVTISKNDSISFTKPAYTFSIGNEDNLYVRLYDGLTYHLIDAKELNWELVGDIGHLDPNTGRFTALRSGSAIVKVKFPTENLSAESSIIVNNRSE